MTNVATSAVAVGRGQAVDAQNPWPGLVAYEEQFQQFFYGRAQEADDLFRRVKRKKLTVLYGRSGLGKTSLLRAGLFPKLRQEGFLPVSIRLNYADDAPGLTVQVKTALVEAYRNADLAEATVPSPDETLWEYFHRLDLRLVARDGSPVHPVLVFDQFEEIFTLGQAGKPGSRTPGGEFFAELSDLVENRSPAVLEQRLEENPELVEKFVFDQQGYGILLSLREDYLPELESLQSSMPSIATSRMRLTRMDDRQAFEVVVRPGGAFVSMEVAREIVRFVGSGHLDKAGPGSEGRTDKAPSGLEVEPSLLSLVCRELNNRRLERGMDQITPDLLAGSRERILQDFYERCMADQAVAVRAFVEDELVTDSGFRENIALARARRALLERGAAPEAIDELVKRRLLHVEEHLGHHRVELTHDILVPVVMKSRDQRQQQEAIRRARQMQQDERHKARQQRRRLLLIVTGMAAALAIVSGFGSVSFYLYRASQERFREANEQRRRAESQTQRADEQARLAQQQTAIAKEQEQLAEAQRTRAEQQTRVAQEQSKRAASEEEIARREKEAAEIAQRNLKQAFDNLQKNAYVLRIGRADQLWRRGNNVGAEELLNQCPPELRNWEWRYLRSLASSDLFALHGRGTTLQNVTYSPDGTSLASASSNGDIEIWDAVTYQRIRIINGFGQSCNDLAFSPDSRFIASASDDKTLKIWIRASGQLHLTLKGHTGSLKNVAFSSDGKMVASLANDRSVKVWNVTDGAEADSFAIDDVDVSAGISFDPQGLLAAASGSTILLRDPVRHRTTRSLISSETFVTGLVYSRDGRYLVSGRRDGTIKVWETTGWRVVHVLQGHASEIARVTISPDGKQLASASMDRSVKVWDLESGAEQQTMRGEGGSVNGVAFSGDGQKLAACSRNEIKIWSSKKQPNAQRLWPGTEIAGVAFSPDGTRLAACANRVTVWDARTGILTHNFAADASIARCVAFSADGSLLAAGNESGVVRVWKLSRGNRLLFKLTGHKGPIRSVAFHPSRPCLASASEDKTIRIWNVATGTLERQLDKHTGEVRQVAFSPSGQWLASSSHDRTVRIWDTSSWTDHLTKPYATDRWPCVAFLSDDLIATGSNDSLGAHEVKIWSPHTGVDWRPPGTNEPLVLRGHGSGIFAIAVGRNRVATSSQDGTAKIWDSATGDELLTLSDAKGYLYAIALSGDGRRLAVGSVDGVRIWEGACQEAFVLRSHTNVVHCVAFSPDGKTLASAGNAAVKLWDVRSGRELPRLPMNHPSRIDGVAYRPDGKQLAAGCSLYDSNAHKYRGEVRIWETGTGKLLHTFAGHTNLIRWIVYHPGGRLIATASDDATVKIWDTSNGHELRTLPASDRKSEGHHDSINGLAISPDGARLASAGTDGTVKIWDFNSGRLLQTLQAHTGYVTDVAYSGDGKWLASASADKTVILWKNGPQVVKERLLTGHIGAVECVGFSADSSQVTSGANDGTVMGWEIVTGRQVLLLRGHSGRVITLASSSDGKYLASGGDDMTVRIWGTNENRDDVFAWHWRLAEDFRSAKRWAEATVDVNSLVELEPHNARVLNLRGTIYGESGKTDLAIADYSQAIDINPEFATYYRNRAVCYQRKKDFNAAFADYAQAVRINPQDDVALFRMANIRYGQGNYAGAIADYTRELAITPDHAGGYYARGRCKLKLHDLNGAIEDFSRTIKLTPTDTLALEWRAVAHFQKGAWSAAVDDYTRELAILPKHANGYCDRGRARLHLGDLKGAADDFSKAITLAPKDMTPVYWRALTRLVLRDWRGSLSDLQLAISLQPGFKKLLEQQRLPGRNDNRKSSTANTQT
jgi:WD40 repeat protein